MLVRVNAAELKSLFKNIRPIFKNAQDGALMGFHLENHVLTVTCANGIVYCQRIASELAGPYDLTVLHQDLSELLPGHGTVNLELEPLYVRISTDNMSSTLRQADGLMAMYRQRVKEFSPIPTAVVTNWAAKFAETSPVAKSMQREASVVFKPPFAIMKFPTFWLQFPNKYLDTVMSLGDLKAVAGFGPTEYGVTEDAIEFRNGAAIMAVTRNSMDTCKFIGEMLGEHKPPKVLASANYLPKIQTFLRSVGAGSCRAYFHEDGLALAVSRPHTESSCKIGACTSPAVSAVTTFLEYIQMIFKICGEGSIAVSSSNSSVCFSTDAVTMLLSII